MTNEITIIDGFDAYANDPTASPIRGTNIKFKDGDYFAFSEKIDVRGESYVVIDQHKGWQKLERDCSPEYLMQKKGEPRPQQPHVEPEDWPLDLNDKPAHPWKWTTFLWLLNAKTGEVSTFWTNTTGGNVALGELSDQVSFMRQVQRHAMPVIALEARDMPTRYGGTTPRPCFHILGWRQRSDTGAPALLEGPEAAPQLDLPLNEVKEPSLAEEMNDEIPDFESEKAESPKVSAPPLPTPRRNLKKPAKTGAKKPPPKRRPPNILDAG
jgi:hypothetical protein